MEGGAWVWGLGHVAAWGWGLGGCELETGLELGFGAWVLGIHGKGQAQRLGAGLVRRLLAAVEATLLQPWRGPLAATGPAAVSPPSAVAIARAAATAAATAAAAAAAAVAAAL